MTILVQLQQTQHKIKGLDVSFGKYDKLQQNNGIGYIYIYIYDRDK